MFAFLGIFYFSCGQELYVRESDGNVDEFYATNDVGELTQGMSAAQIYTSQMDIIDAVGVMASNYGRDLTSEFYIRCEDVTDGICLRSRHLPQIRLESTNMYICRYQAVSKRSGATR